MAASIPKVQSLFKSLFSILSNHGNACQTVEELAFIHATNFVRSRCILPF